MNDVYVTMSVRARTPEVLTRAMESLARAAAGLALEGVDTTLTATQLDDEGDQ